jgi:Protein of unknown function (DUF2695)
MHSLDPQDQELGDDIGPDVLKALNSRRFFERLEELVFPEGDSGVRKCEHTFGGTDSILLELGFDEAEREDIIIVFKSLGGFCDCEVLYNADDREESPKARYWRSQSAAAGAEA